MSKMPCSDCSKKFRTESGLRWHLFHIHQWGDVDDILQEPSPARLAKIALLRELFLAAFAKGFGCDVQAMQNLIGKHFGKYDSGPPPQGATQHVPSVNTDEP